MALLIPSSWFQVANPRCRSTWTRDFNVTDAWGFASSHARVVDASVLVGMPNEHIKKKIHDCGVNICEMLPDVGFSTPQH